MNSLLTQSRNAIPECSPLAARLKNSQIPLLKRINTATTYFTLSTENARFGVELSREARVRLAWMDFYRRCRNVAQTCRHFGISRQTFYRWQRRYDPYDLSTLEERSHCPRRRRQPTWSFPLEEEVFWAPIQRTRRAGNGHRSDWRR